MNLLPKNKSIATLEKQNRKVKTTTPTLEQYFENSYLKFSN